MRANHMRGAVGGAYRWDTGDTELKRLAVLRDDFSAQRGITQLGEGRHRQSGGRPDRHQSVRIGDVVVLREVGVQQRIVNLIECGA